MMEENVSFWAENIANKVLTRKKFHFSDTAIPEIKNPTVKSSSSLSGVLHIGRLSDIIRGEAVYRAIKENNDKINFIYVTEDMDPFRKVPKGVPKDFEQYLGMPVSDVPDPDGCHESYGVHFKEKFLETFSDFLVYDPKVYSMREEYKQGNFTPFILEMVEKTEQVKEILQKFQDSTVAENWTPWKPICDNCGKLQTTVITKIDGTKIHYKCEDYAFEKTKAIGCKHEGVSDLKKANGKLVWKSEWAAQWKRWQVVSEGAGKEYNAPNSAWFVNAEMCENVLNFPMPEPIFYEHLFIDDKKMSASLGNVVYPHEWLEVGRPEALKLLYMKKINKTRSFSWKDLPLLESELDKAVFATTKGDLQKEDIQKELSKSGLSIKMTKEETQLFNLYKYSQVEGRTVLPILAEYSLVAYLVDEYSDNQSFFEKLVEMEHADKNLSKERKEQLFERMNHARVWVEKYSPEHKIELVEEYSKDAIDEKIKGLFSSIADDLLLPVNEKPKAIQQLIFSTAEVNKVKPSEFFKALYQVIIGKERGPKMGTVIYKIGREKVSKRLKELN